MSFGGGGGGNGSISGATDVFLSTVANNDVLSYNSSTLKWINAPVAASGSGFTAAKNVATAGNVVLTAGTSAQLQKFVAILSANRTISLAGTTPNAYFDISLIDMSFNGFNITITNGSFSHVFSYPTYVRYVYIGSAWERFL